jgi:RimJ/RimL family protein N-acetyltransferase
MTIPELGSARPRLVPAQPADLGLLWEHWRREPVRQYLWDGIEISREQAEQVLQSSRAASRHGLGLWCLRLAGDVFAGFVALRFVGAGEVELLYGLEPHSWGQGLATEAARCVLRYAFDTLGLDRVLAGADPPNGRSFAVLDRLGMEPLESSPVPGVEYRQLTCARFHLLDARGGDLSWEGKPGGEP